MPRTIVEFVLLPILTTGKVGYPTIEGQPGLNYSAWSFRICLPKERQKQLSIILKSEDMSSMPSISIRYADRFLKRASLPRTRGFFVTLLATIYARMSCSCDHTSPSF